MEIQVIEKTNGRINRVTGTTIKERLRVCAYCRVSTDNEEQLNSYQSQLKYYDEKINSCSPYNVKNLFDVYKKVLEVGAARWRVFDLGFQGDFVDKKQKFNLESYYYIKVNTKITKKGKMFFTNLGNINYVDTLLIFSI